MTPPRRRVLLDTDIASDVDDALALTALLGSPEVELVACTTVYGDVLLRARVAAHVLRLAGRAGRVVPGAASPLSGRPVWTSGNEGSLHGDLSGERVDEAADAVDVLVQEVAADPGGVDVVAIGPLTNIALALRRDPRFARDVRRLWVMGGRFDDPSAPPEHNLASDAVAAAEVFASGVPITAVGLDATRQVELEPGDVDGLAAAGRLGALLAAEVRQWLAHWDDERDVPHDATTVVALLRPDLFGVEACSVEVEVGDDPAGGRSGTSRAKPGGPVDVVRRVDAGGVRAEVVRRLLLGCG